MADFATAKLIQDFSYAGYACGDRPIPTPTGPLFDVTTAPYGADPTGSSDSTQQIQAAIVAIGLTGFWTELIYGLIIILSVSMHAILRRRVE